MKLKDGIIITEVDGSFFAVDAGLKGKRFSGMIKMNKTSAELAKALQKGSDEETLAADLCDKYEVDRETALADVRKVVESLRSVGLIED